MAITLPDNFQVAPGVRAAFYPMRPTLGTTITTESSIERVVSLVNDGWYLQPKLNGDRATLTVFDGEVFLFNRHGSAFKHTVLNREDYRSLPHLTTLDGEVYERHFTPFEALVYGGKSLMGEDVLVRAGQAKEIAEKYDEWMFEPPTYAQLVELLKVQSKLRVPKWEGVVRKKRNSPYNQMFTEGQESPLMFKHKWC